MNLFFCTVIPHDLTGFHSIRNYLRQIKLKRYRPTFNIVPWLYTVVTQFIARTDIQSSGERGSPAYLVRPTHFLRYLLPRCCLRTHRVNFINILQKGQIKANAALKTFKLNFYLIFRLLIMQKCRISAQFCQMMFQSKSICSKTKLLWCQKCWWN